jgi:hypothetical protein
MLEAIGAAIERACARWPGAALTLFVLACYVAGAISDGETP